MTNEEIERIMKEYGLDEEDAKKVQEIMEDEGIDEDEAEELVEGF